MKVEVANRILPALSEYAVCGGEAAEGMWVGVVVLFSLQVFSCLVFSFIYLHGTEDMYRVEIIINTTTTITTTTNNNHNHQIS